MGGCVIGTILFGKNIQGIISLVLKTSVLGLMCIYAGRNKERLGRLINSTILLFVVYILLNILFIFILPNGSFTLPSYNSAGELVYTYFLGPKNNFTTIGLCAICFVSIYEIMHKGKPGSYTYAMIFLLVFNMYKVNCSTGLLIYLMELLILFLGVNKILKKKIYRELLYLISIVVTAVLIIVLGQDVLQETTHSRWLIWIEAVKLFIFNPILGYGMQLEHDLIYLYGSYRYSHNEILEILLYGGIPALVCYIYLIKSSIRREFCNRKIKESYILFLVLYFVAQIFEAQFTSLYIFYVVFLVDAINNNENISKRLYR